MWNLLGISTSVSSQSWVCSSKYPVLLVLDGQASLKAKGKFSPSQRKDLRWENPDKRLGMGIVLEEIVLLQPLGWARGSLSSVGVWRRERVVGAAAPEGHRRSFQPRLFPPSETSIPYLKRKLVSTKELGGNVLPLTWGCSTLSCSAAPREAAGLAPAGQHLQGCVEEPPGVSPLRPWPPRAASCTSAGAAGAG